MPGLLSAAMLAELRRKDCGAHCVGKLFLDDPRVYADRPIASATLGKIQGRVINWGNVRRQRSDDNGGLIFGNTFVELRDEDRAFARLVASAQARTLRGTRWVSQLISDRVDPSDWFTFYDGYLENKEMVSPYTWKLGLHPNDQPLRGVFPKTSIPQADFPNAGDKTVYGQFPNIIYGVHDSRASSDAGMIPCPYVDRLGFRYLVSIGWTTVDRVYKDGAQVSASNYAITHPTINGRLYTLIDFTSDQTAAAEITADVTGYTANADGTGGVLKGVDALKHLLVNWVWGDSTGVAWLSDSTAPVDTTYFTASQTFLTDMGWEKVSRRYGGESQTTGLAAIAEFCSKPSLKAFFTAEGLLAIRPVDHRLTTLWHTGTQWIRHDKHELGERGGAGNLQLPYDRSSIATRITAQSIYNSARGQFMSALEVRDLTIEEDAATDLPLPYSHASYAA
jgi:hypothetical protein